jgi:hypothetical protein
MDGRKTKREAKSREPLLACRVEPKTTAKIVGLFRYIPATVVGLNNPDVRY